MKTITTKQLAQILAGGDSYIRTKGGVVKGLAITIAKNPEAPEIIIVGKKPRVVANAHVLLKSNKPVPVYLKQAINNWKYIGIYKAECYRKDQETIKKHCGPRSENEVDGILFLSSIDDNVEVKVSQRSMARVGVTKKVEMAAIQFVAEYYRRLGFRVEDRQKQNCGYDLLVKEGSRCEKIEVKGTSSIVPRFFITKNEMIKSADPTWRLIVVTDVLSNPQMKIFNAEKMKRKFKFDALICECTEKMRTK